MNSGYTMAMMAAPFQNVQYIVASVHTEPKPARAAGRRPAPRRHAPHTSRAPHQGVRRLARELTGTARGLSLRSAPSDVPDLQGKG